MTRPEFIATTASRLYADMQHFHAFSRMSDLCANDVIRMAKILANALEATTDCPWQQPSVPVDHTWMSIGPNAERCSLSVGHVALHWCEATHASWSNDGRCQKTPGCVLYQLHGGGCIMGR